MTEARLRVKKWEEFQHYSDRTPPWIKLYNGLLEDYEFAALPDASKAHLVGIWLLASRMQNSIPADADWIASKINATGKIALSTLLSSGFIELCGDASDALADCKQDARPEGEGEREENILGAFPRKPRKAADGSYLYPEAFERAWSEYPSRDGSNPKVGAYQAFRSRVASGAAPEQLVIAARHYREYHRRRGSEGGKYVLQAATFYGHKEPWREYLEPPKSAANGQGALARPSLARPA